MFLIGALLACGPAPTAAPDLPAEAVAAYVRDDIADPGPWAADVRAALQAAGRPVDADHVCQVLAVIEQESGDDPDPEVPRLGEITRAALRDELARLGPATEPAIDALLTPTAPDADASFDERLDDVRTERDLDLWFQDLAAHHARAADGVPLLDGLVDRRIERWNPVTTAGSMQVSVRWAQDQARDLGLSRETVRDALYTRTGGVHWGTARLFSDDADYDDPIYRFADFNAGPFASRNAAFQAQLGELVALDLDTDGDLMRWTRRGKPRDGQTLNALLLWRALHAPDLPERRVRRDARLEKSLAFEDTDTWHGVRGSYEAMAGSDATYAQIPDIDLDSPKITRDWTTAWFAERVDRRYRACLDRG